MTEKVVNQEATDRHKLILEHWDYVQESLLALQVDRDNINLIKFHYCSAFEHGMKHQKELDYNNTHSNLLPHTLNIKPDENITTVLAK